MKSYIKNLSLLAALIAGLSSISAVRVQAQTMYVWTAGSFTDTIQGNGNNDWNNPANWDLGTVPTTNDIAVINSGAPDNTSIGTVTIYGVNLAGGTLPSAGMVINNLNMSGGTINPGSVVISSNGIFNWSGGIIAASMSLSPSVQFNITGDGVRSLNTSVILSSAGPGTWSGSGRLNMANGSVLSNSGTFTVQDDPTAFNTGGIPIFVNNGTFIKTGLATNAFLSDNGGVAFNNNGTVNVQGGVLLLGGGGTGTNGNYNTTTSSRIDWTDRSLSMIGNTSFTGGGTNRLMGAILTFDGGTTTLSGGNNFEVASGTVLGSSGFAGTGTFTWSGGGIGANLSLAAGVSLNITGNAARTLHTSATLSSAGAGTWSGSGRLNMANSSVLNNSGTFIVLGDAETFNSTGGDPVFINNGTFIKTGGMNTSFLPDNGGVAFNNNGTVSVQSGVLVLGGGGTGTNGTHNVAPGSRLDLTNGTFTLKGNTSFTGGGSERVIGTFLTFSGGTTTLSGGNNFEVAGGTVLGSSGFAGTGTFTWTGGGIGANLSLAAGVSLNISGNAVRTLYTSATLSSAGSGTWSGSGRLNMANSSMLSNSGTFTVLGDAETFNTTGGDPVFINNGTFIKTGGTNTSFPPDNSGVAFNNNGTVSVQSGVLVLGGGGMSTNGTYNVAPGSRLDLTNGTFTLKGNTSFTGGGSERVIGTTLTFSGGTTTLSDGNNFEVASGTVLGSSSFAGTGTFTWTGGSIGANLSLSAGINFNISGNNIRNLNTSATLSSTGTGTWSGSGRLNMANASVLSNSGTFTVLGDGEIFNTTGGNPVFINNGTFIKTGGTNTSFLPDNGGVAFNNNGRVDLRSGVLTLGGSYTPSPSSQLNVVIGGLAPRTQYSQLNLAATPALAGTLSASLANSFSPTNGDFFDIVNYPSHTTEFASALLPALNPGLGWRITYSANSVRLGVVAALSVSDLVKQPNGPFQMTLSGPPSTAIIFQVSTNLINWDNLSTNKPFTGSFLFQDPQAALFTNRFYHLIFVP